MPKGEWLLKTIPAEPAGGFWLQPRSEPRSERHSHSKSGSSVLSLATPGSSACSRFVVQGAAEDTSRGETSEWAQIQRAGS